MKTSLKNLSLTVATTMLLSACGGGGSGGSANNTGISNNKPSPTVQPAPPTNIDVSDNQATSLAPADAPPITVAKGHVNVPDPVSPQEEKKIAVYNVRHYLDYSEQNIKDFMVEGNIISLPNTNYQVGDTVEFKDTIIKIDSLVENAKYAIVPAELFDVFSQLEIKTSMQMTSNQPMQAGLLTGRDLFKESENAYKELKEKGCLANARTDINIHSREIHKNPAGNGVYNGVQLALDKCKIYDEDGANLTLDASVNVGAKVTNFDISKKEKKVNFNLDGASLLTGKLHLQYDRSNQSSVRLATYKPAILKGLEASKVKTLEKLLKAEIFLNFKTLVDGKFEGAVGVQIPADFAVGIDARFDEKAKEWIVTPYSLKNNNYVQLDTKSMGLGYEVEAMNVHLGAALTAGYLFDLKAETPWIEEKDEQSWWDRLVQEQQAGFSADLQAYSRTEVSAGVIFDTFAGTQVDLAKCRANLDMVAGFDTYNLFQFRVGAYRPDEFRFSQRNDIWNRNTQFRLGSWDLFKQFSLNKSDWCGPNSKLKGHIGGNSKRIFVSDKKGKVLYDAKYIQNWGNADASSLQSGVLQAGLTQSQKDTIWRKIQLFVKPNEVVQQFALPTQSAKGDINIGFQDESGRFDIKDKGWLFAWKTFNPHIKIHNDDTQNPTLEINCVGKCSQEPILFVARSPEDKYIYLQYTPQFEDVLSVDAMASHSSAILTLQANANLQGANYTWKTSDGKILTTTKNTLTVPKTSQFGAKAVQDGKISLTVDKDYQSKTIDIPIKATVMNNQQAIEYGINNLTGYWKSACFREGYNKSSFVYLKINKLSNNTIEVPQSIDSIYNNSNCSGTPDEVIVRQDKDQHTLSDPKQNGSVWSYYATNSDGDRLTLHSQDKFQVGDEQFFRIGQALYDGMLKTSQPTTNNRGIVREGWGNDRDALISPNGGEHWRNGQTQTIYWMNQYITGSTVDLYVLHDDPKGLVGNTSKNVGTTINQKNWYKFASNVPNTGRYSLDPAKMAGSGNAYMVLIVSTSDNSKFDISNDRFSLN